MMSKWEMVSFGDAIDDVTKKATKIKKEDYLTQGQYYIIDQGKGYLAGYANSPDGLYTDVPAIVFGDHTRIIKYVDRPLFIGADGVKLLKIKSDEFAPKYVYYYLKSCRIIDTGYNRHFKWLKEFDIPQPSLPVQQQIADVLDRASALIEKRKAQIEKLDLLVKSQFIEMFGDLKSNDMEWEMHPFSYVATIDTQMTNDFDTYADYPHIGIDSIEKDTGRILEYKLVKESDLKSGKYLFNEQHLIYSKIRPNLNKVAKPQFKGVCSADAYPILPSDKSNREYLAIVLRSDFFLDYILAFSGRTNIPKVNQKQLDGFCLPVPPMPIQSQFATFVQTVEAQKSLLQQSLAKLEQNYKSLMQKCFRGEVFS